MSRFWKLCKLGSKKQKTFFSWWAQQKLEIFKWDFFYKNGHNFALFSSILKISVPKNIYIFISKSPDAQGWFRPRQVIPREWFQPKSTRCPRDYLTRSKSPEGTGSYWLRQQPWQPTREGDLVEGKSQIALSEPNQPTREGDLEEGESQIALLEPNQPTREGDLAEGKSQIALSEPNQPTREGDLEEGESQIALPEPNQPTSEPNQPTSEPNQPGILQNAM